MVVAIKTRITHLRLFCCFCKLEAEYKRIRLKQEIENLIPILNIFLIYAHSNHVFFKNKMLKSLHFQDLFLKN